MKASIENNNVWGGNSRTVAAIITIVAVALIVSVFYGPFVNNFFAFDDFRYIENLFSTPTALLFGYNSTRFLSNLVFSPLFELSGYNPAGYNLFNMILHGLNSLLLGALAARLSGKTVVGAFTGILFAASAAPADALLWKCACNSLMSAFFSLLTFHLYLNWRNRGKVGHMVASIAVFLAAMFSKEDAAALPILIFVYELVCQRDIKRSVLNTAPYVSVVALYLVMAQVMMKALHVPLEHYERFLSFRPLYALAGGYASFLMDPTGVIHSFGIPVSICIVVIIVAVVMIRDRRLLVFALLGIIVTFLPSSLTSLGTFEPDIILKSVSRYLYLPTGMVALILAMLLVEAQRRLPKFVGVMVVFLLISMFIGYNYRQVYKRGMEWRETSEPVRGFLLSMKALTPSFPKNSYVFVDEPPVGRAYVQQSLRAFYQEPTITWIVDPTTFKLPAGAQAFMIHCYWLTNYEVRVSIVPFELFRAGGM